MKKLIGPFKQILTMRGLPVKGSIKDGSLEILKDAGVLINGNVIADIGSFDSLSKKHSDAQVAETNSDKVLLPGFIDSHTHICFAGNRSADFAKRNAGVSYQEIAAAGGGIWHSVSHTREASETELIELMKPRVERLKSQGITTIEIKSGYGLSKEHELKMLRAINALSSQVNTSIVPTCLAAHIIPKDFNGSEAEYLEMILNDLVPEIEKEKLCNRFDVFIEENAFSINESKKYLSKLKDRGFDLTVHGDQFSVGGSKVAVECGALSVDHLEVSGEQEINMLAKSDIVATALPGASLGIGCEYTPARKLLDAGACLAIASDWNPGSAPMGNLICQASILACYEKLSSAEVFAGITYRAAKALNLKDRGKLEIGMKADFAIFDTDDYRDILYNQGEMKASETIIS